MPRIGEHVVSRLAEAERQTATRRIRTHAGPVAVGAASSAAGREQARGRRGDPEPDEGRSTALSHQLPRWQWRSALRQPSTSACRSPWRQALKKSAWAEYGLPDARVTAPAPVTG